MASDKYETTGTVHAIGAPVERGSGDRKFSSRKIHLAIDRDGKYPQTVEFEVGGKSLDMFDRCSVGDEVTVTWNLRGREWTDPKTGVIKVFNTLSPWKVDIKANGRPAPPPDPNGGGWGPRPGDDPNGDDIPFARCGIEHEPSPLARAVRRGP